jgi:hypothetical protein
MHCDSSCVRERRWQHGLVIQQEMIYWTLADVKAKWNMDEVILSLSM